MSRQLAAVAEKVLLTPANVIRGLPVKSAAAEVATKPGQYGKLGWRNWWPAEYSKPYNPRMMAHPYTFFAKMRTAPWQHMWEHMPIWRFLIYGHFFGLIFALWFDKNLMMTEASKRALTAMVVDDLNEQRRVLFQHVQKHHDHAYFKHKRCHDGHPLGHGVSDAHVF